jgi:spiro-SPASM protein
MAATAPDDAGRRPAAAVCAALQSRPGILRTLPAFFPVQVVGRCPQACSYCPYPAAFGDVRRVAGAMPVDEFVRLAQKIAAFAGDAVIDISLWGEPALHPAIHELIAGALSVPGIELVVETSGVGWAPGTLAKLRAQVPRSPTWIVSLDAATEAVYRSLRGEGFAEAVKTADELLSLYPGSAWVQAVRMAGTEEDLDAFWRGWKARTPNVIVQKYDSFAGFLPDRKVADLSPVTRFPCWHVRRDMPILLDGRVPLCREDVKGESPLGNAFREELPVIWERGRAAWEAHVAGDLPPMCRRCDEYYTYNY